MKLKKLFAGIVAAAMMLTMGATAFAAKTAPIEVTNNGSGTFPITKSYTALNKGSVLPNETFKLKQVAKDHKQMAASYTEVPDLVTVEGQEKGIVGVLEYKDGNWVQNTEGKFIIGLPEYKGIGVFTYELEEVASENAGVNNDTRHFIVTVYALQGDNGIETKVTVIDKANTTDKMDKIDSINNVFKAGTLTIHKDVKGQLGDKSYEFPFKVTFESTKPVTAKVTTSATTNNEVTFTKNGDKYTAEVTFNLKNGEDFSINNLPYDVTYTVKEVGEEENAEGKKQLTTGKTADEQITYDVTYSATEGTVADDTKTVTVTNQAGNMNIDTGVILDNAPYIALLTIVAFGAVALVLNKRRRDEE